MLQWFKKWAYLTILMSMLLGSGYGHAANYATLYEAARAGDLQKVNEFIAMGADVNMREEFTGRAPLFAALKSKKPEVVKALLDAGANVHSKGTMYSDSPIGYALGLDNPAILKLLMERGVNVNEKDSSGTTLFAIALMEACNSGHTSTVAMLLDHGADVNMEMGEIDAMSMSPLGGAILSKNNKLSRLLLERGANANGKINMGNGKFSLLALATAMNQTEVVKLLLAGGASKEGMGKDMPIAKAYMKELQEYRLRGYQAQLKADLKNIYTASQAYLSDNPSGTVTAMKQLKNFVRLSDNVEFVRANLSEKKGVIVLRHKELKNINTKLVKGLKAGEGMVTHEGALVCPELK